MDINALISQKNNLEEFAARLTQEYIKFLVPLLTTVENLGGVTVRNEIYTSRKHPRLNDYDYDQNGCYFITLCTKNKAKILCEIVGRGFLDAPHTALTAFGKCVSDAIKFLNRKTSGIDINHFIIMPNHVHMLVMIHEEENGGASGKPRPTNNVLSKIMSSLKDIPTEHADYSCSKKEKTPQQQFVEAFCNKVLISPVRPISRG